MKLQKFNRANTQTRVDGKPSVRINRSGTFAFNKSAADVLGFKPGSKVNLLQDVDRPRDWYIQLTTDEDGLKVRKYKTGFIVGAVIIAHKIFTAINLPVGEKSAALRIANTPVDDNCFAILTNAYTSPVNKL